jgi:hypothetical protein
MIRVDGLFFLNVSQNWFKLINELHGWLDVSAEKSKTNDLKLQTNASNLTELTSSSVVVASEQKIFSLKKKSLCDP